MSVHFTLYVNDASVGQVVITRDVEGQEPEEVNRRDVTQPYKWLVRQWQPEERVTGGRCYHRPDEGIWRLIQRVTERIPEMEAVAQ